MEGSVSAPALGVSGEGGCESPVGLFFVSFCGGGWFLTGRCQFNIKKKNFVFHASA